MTHWAPTVSKISNGLEVLFGLWTINAGLNKFFFYMPEPSVSRSGKLLLETLTENPGLIHAVGFLIPALGFLEVAIGIAFLYRRFRPVMALLLLPIIFAIVVGKLIMVPSSASPIITMLLLNGWMVYRFRKKYAPMFALDDQGNRGRKPEASTP